MTELLDLRTGAGRRGFVRHRRPGLRFALPLAFVRE